MSTPSRIDEIRRRIGAGERGQTRHATWLLDWIGEANPNKLTVATIRKMERDPQVRAGLLIRELAILGKPGAFHYKPRHPKNAGEVDLGKRMVAFLTHVWENLQPNPHVALHHLLGGRRFGFVVLEKIWASAPGLEGKPVLRLSDHPDFPGFVWIERLKLLPPESLENAGFASDIFGNLTGVFQHFTPPTVTGMPITGLAYAAQATGAPFVAFKGDDLKRLIVYRANYEDGQLYGRSDLEAAYNVWYSKQAAHAWRNQLLERLSGTVIGEAEAGQLDKLKAALQEVGPAGVLAVPKDSKVQLLQGWEGAVRGYQEAIGYDDHQILRAVLVPDLAVGGGAAQEGGSYARAASDFNALMLVCRQLQLELEEVIEEQLVRPLIDANFGPQPTYPTFDFPQLQEKDREQLARVFDWAIKGGWADPSIDAAFMRLETGLPEAPEGFEFERPEQPSLFGEPGDPEDPEAQREQREEKRGQASARAPPAPAGPSGVYERAEPRQGRRLLVERLEAKARARVGDAAERLRDQVLTNLPQSAEPREVEKVYVPTMWLAAALDDVAAQVLAEVAHDAARTWRGLGRDDVARRVDALAKGEASARAPAGGLRGLVARISARTPRETEDALRAYTQWARQLNESQSRTAAADLAEQLRRRILDAYSLGMSPGEVAQALEADFASYTLRQIESVAGTTLMDMVNSARNATIDAAGDAVQGVKLVPLLDDATTPFCRDLAGRSIAKTDPLYERFRNPPYDYECRTQPLPILTDEPWAFNTDWQAWFEAHRGVPGGRFLYPGAT